MVAFRPVLAARYQQGAAFLHQQVEIGLFATFGYGQRHNIFPHLLAVFIFVAREGVCLAGLQMLVVGGTGTAAGSVVEHHITRQ